MSLLLLGFTSVQLFQKSTLQIVIKLDTLLNNKPEIFFFWYVFFTLYKLKPALFRILLLAEMNKFQIHDSQKIRLVPLV